MSTLANRYRLIERLGAGGMSVVWRAFDPVLGRQVAIKVLAPGFAADAGFRDRIRREARAAARLSHPTITNVYDYGESTAGGGATTPYVVMELVEGESLAQRLGRGVLPWPQAMAVAGQVATALSVAHARGLVHRDITPGNVMLTPAGVKVVDFGISAVAGERGESLVLGTPAYLAPERLAGGPVLPPVDVYCLGVLVHHMLTGRPAPGPGQPSAVPGLAAVPGLPPAVGPLLARCLAADPRYRPAAAELAGVFTRLARLGPAAVPGRTVAAPPVPGPARTGHGPTGTRPLPVPPPGPVRVPLPVRRRRWPRVLGALALIVLVFLCGAVYASGRRAGGAGAGTAGAGVAPPVHPSPTPAPRCQVGYDVTSDWKVAFTANVRITNSGTARISGWTLAFDFPDGQRLAGGWLGRWAQDGTRVTVSDQDYNALIKPGESVTIGFGATYTGRNGPPSGFTVNGLRCAVPAPTASLTKR